MSYSTAEEGAEVRPYPGLVDGLDELLSDSDDDQIVSVACGARYTVATSLKKRVLVWGQVAPSIDSGDGGVGIHPGCSSGNVTSDFPTAPFFRPMELKPMDILRSASLLAGSTGGGKNIIPFYSKNELSGKYTSDKAAPERVGDCGSEEWRLRISTVGCGPWYIVLGLEQETRRQEGRGEL